MTIDRRRRGPFVLLEAATLMSGSGNGVVVVTLPWLALERTGNAATAGVVAAATALPLLASALLAGSVVDRVGRRRAAIVADVLSGVAVALVPIVDHLFGLDLGWLILLAVLGATFDPMGLTGREAMLPDVAAAAELELERVNGIHEAIWGVAFLLGPGIGGFLIASIGAVNTMWAAAIGFGASALLISAIRLDSLRRPAPRDVMATLVPDRVAEGEREDPHATPEPPEPGRPNIWRETADGIRFVWRDRLLRSVWLLSLGMLATYLPLEGVLFPAWFEEQDSPERLGLLIMAMSAGGIVGALSYSAWGSRVGRRSTFVVSLVVSGLSIGAMALLPPFPILLVVGFVVGLAYGPINPLVNLAIQTRAPEHARGRVTGLLNSTGDAAGPAGFLLVGPLIEWVGIQTAMVAVALVVLAVALSSIPSKGLRTFDDVDPTRSAPGGPASPDGRGTTAPSVVVPGDEVVDP